MPPQLHHCPIVLGFRVRAEFGIGLLDVLSVVLPVDQQKYVATDSFVAQCSARVACLSHTARQALVKLGPPRTGGKCNN